MTNIKTIAAHLALAVFVTTPAFANDLANGRCKTVNWSPGDIVTVEASMYKSTHISLPEDALDIVWGSKELWEKEFIRSHIFVKPLSAQPEGSESTATAVGASGASYEFRLIRVGKLSSHCVNLKSSGGMLNRANWTANAKPSNPEADEQIAVLQAQLLRATAEKTQLAAEAQRQTSMAVKSYRTALFSNYDWDTGTGWFAKSGIETVQDDGRFTYIRLKSDNRGIMSISADIDGQSEVLEKVYDAPKREYRIAGVYPKFKLRAGDSEMTITRGQ